MSKSKTHPLTLSCRQHIIAVTIHSRSFSNGIIPGFWECQIEVAHEKTYKDTDNFLVAFVGDM
jgi:hypothetical protein